MENEKIYVFDAYGTLFDVDHACKEMAIQLGDNWDKLSSIWRQKQLEYSWLYNSMNEYDSFWKITKDSLEYAMNSLSINSVKIKNELYSFIELCNQLYSNCFCRHILDSFSQLSPNWIAISLHA